MTYKYSAKPTPLGKVQKPPYTVEASGFQPVEGETIPRRHPKAKDGLLERPAPEVNTTFDLLKRSAELYGNEPAVGSRKLIHTHREKKKVPKVVDGKTTEVEKEWTYYELSEYTYITYQEYFTQVLQVGAGLRKLGLAPKDRLHIFATTRYDHTLKHVLSWNMQLLTLKMNDAARNGSPWHTHAPHNP